MAKAQHHEKPLAQNKKARHDYRIVSTIEAGIVLTGTEIKSVRASRVTLKDGFAQVRNGEVWLMNVHIAQYAHPGGFSRTRAAAAPAGARSRSPSILLPLSHLAAALIDASGGHGAPHRGEGIDAAAPSQHGTGI